MSRYCASCGTEVDDTAIFCPTCGQPIDQDVETAIPAAPAWPDPSEAGRSVPSEDFTREMDAASTSAARDEPAAVGWDAPHAAGWDDPGLSGWDEPAQPAPPPSPARADAEPIQPVSERRPDPDDAPRPASERPRDDGPGPAPQPGHDPAASPGPPRQAAAGGGVRQAPRTSPLANLPVTAPVTLSGWLIGVGAAIAAIGALVSLFDAVGAVVDLLLLIALAGVALAVFASSALPAFGHLRLVTFAIVLVAFGAGADRLLGGGGTGVGELLLFLGTAAATIGALLVELGRDQPLGGPRR